MLGHDMIKSNERADQRENEKNIILKKKIEDAIRNSLDPLSAQRALESLHPLLLDLSGADKRQRLPQKKLNHKDCQQQQLSSHSHGKDFAQKKCDNRVTLPSIETILDNYRREPLKDLNSNYGPRCSVSEPIPVLEMFDQRSTNLIGPIDHSAAIKNQRQRQCQSQNSNNVAHQICNKTASYDADAAISLLRLERTTRTDFSTFWDWKKKRNADPNGLNTITSEQSENNPLIRESKATDCNVKGNDKVEKESKVGRVKRMQQAYMPPLSHEGTEQCQSTFIPQLHSSTSIASRSLEHDHAPSHHCSANSDQYDGGETVSGHNFHHSESHVTDSDIISVSKYFCVSDKSHGKFSYNDIPADPPNNMRDQSIVIGRNCSDRMRVSSSTGDGTSSEGTLSTRESYDTGIVDTSQSESQSRNSSGNISKRSELTQLPPAVPHSAITPMDNSPHTSSSKEHLRIALRPINPSSRGSNMENFCDFPTANTETPTSNDYSLGGLEGLLDWTRNLDINVV